MKFVKYDGRADGYLLILTNKKRGVGTLRFADEVPVAALHVKKDELIAVSDQDFEILKEQGHIAEDRLHEEKPPAYGPESKPYTRVLDP